MKPVASRNSHGATTVSTKSATGAIIAAASRGTVGTKTLVNGVATARNRGIGSIQRNLGEEIRVTAIFPVFIALRTSATDKAEGVG